MLAVGMRSFLRDAGVEVIDRNFSGQWWFHYTKPATLEWAGLPEIYDVAAYAEWTDKVVADEKKHNPDFFFSAGPQLCALFEKSRAPAICVMGGRIDSDCREPKQFDALIEKTLAGMESGKLRVYSGSQYDVAYFKYFTGKDVPYFPYPVNYLQGGGYSWQLENATRSDILLFSGNVNVRTWSEGYHKFVKPAMDECLQWFEANSDIRLTTDPIYRANNIYRKIAERPVIAKQLKAAIVGFRPANAIHPRAYLSVYRHRIRRALNGFSYRDLLRFKAIVMFPYSIWSGVMLELIEMGVPMFYPSKSLLKRWDESYGMMFHRTHQFGQWRSAGGFSNIAYGADSAPDPNDSVNPEALHYWLEKAEFYNWDVRYFDSPADLHEQLKAADFEAMHRDVLKTRARMDKIRNERWAEIMRDLTKTSSTPA